MQESLTLLEQLYSGLSIELSDDIALSDTAQIGIGTQIQEVVTLTDQLIANTDFTNISTETIHLLDMMKRAVNGVCDKWNDRVEPTTNWVGRAKPTTSWTDRSKPTTPRTSRTKPC